MNRRHSRHSRHIGGRRRRGFTMVEMVVAIALLGIGIAASVACIGSATRASARAEEYTAVELLAREKLAEIEQTAAAEGAAAGDFGPDRPGFAWQTQSESATVGGPMRVTLTILWGNPDRPRQARFVTYVRGNSGAL